MKELALADVVADVCARCEGSLSGAGTWVCGSCKKIQHMDCLQRWGSCPTPECRRAAMPLPSIETLVPRAFDPGPMPLEGAREKDNLLHWTEAGTVVELAPGESAVEVPADVAETTSKLCRIPDRPLGVSRILQGIVFLSFFVLPPYSFLFPLLLVAPTYLAEKREKDRMVRGWLVRNAYGHLEMRVWQVAGEKGEPAGLTRRDVGRRMHFLTDSLGGQDQYFEATELRLRPEVDPAGDPVPDRIELVLQLRSKRGLEQSQVLARCEGRIEDLATPGHAVGRLRLLGEAVSRALKTPFVEPPPPRRGWFS